MNIIIPLIPRENKNIYVAQEHSIKNYLKISNNSENTLTVKEMRCERNWPLEEVASAIEVYDS